MPGQAAIDLTALSPRHRLSPAVMATRPAEQIVQRATMAGMGTG